MKLKKVREHNKSLNLIDSKVKENKISYNLRLVKMADNFQNNTWSFRVIKESDHLLQRAWQIKHVLQISRRKTEFTYLMLAIYS